MTMHKYRIFDSQTGVLVLATDDRHAAYEAVERLVDIGNGSKDFSRARMLVLESMTGEDLWSWFYED